jgi:adenylate cyclase
VASMALPSRRGPPWVRQLRLATGLVLFTFVTTHLLNHALGLVSLDAMEAGRWWFLSFWRSLAGTVLLYGAVLIHIALALWALYQRRHLRLPAPDAWQLGLGLVLPVLLVSHVVGTRLAHELYGFEDSYRVVALTLWELRPELGARQLLVVALAWIHGCLGLRASLRLRPWYPRAVHALFAVALLVPTLAALGFAQGGREAAARARAAGGPEVVRRAAHAPPPAGAEVLETVRHGLLWTYGALLGGVLLARAGRGWAARRRGAIRVGYPDGREVYVPQGFSVLEASRLAGIPHASVCGGRGRCSTCRVRVDRGGAGLPPPAPAERRVLDRIGAPPTVRLACQLRPLRNVDVFPLLPATATARAGAPRSASASGREQEVAVLFADLRGFTRFAEHRLPYDVVFFLNRYFETVGSAIERVGGVANQFTGDGVMALFGVDVSPEVGCRQALEAAVLLHRRIAELSHAMAAELDAPLRIGVGIHVGPAVVGRMGYKAADYLTAVGDTVHVASRLEQLTKDFAAQLVVSEQVARRAGLDVTDWPRHELTLRNRGEPLAVRVLNDVRRLEARLAGDQRPPPLPADDDARAPDSAAVPPG